MDLEAKEYVVIVQCHLVKQRCAGFLCEKSFHERVDGFKDYPAKPLRHINMTCGGCCGRPLHRKLTNLIGQLRKQEKMEKDRIIVQLSSCITKDNFHGPPCPHLDYLKELIAKLELDVLEDTRVSKWSEMRREEGCYKC